MRKQKITKKQIISATAKVISEKGFDDLTVDDIVKTARIAKGSIYTHFKNKEDLFMQAIKFIAQERISSLKKALRQANADTSTKKILLIMKVNEFMFRKDLDSFLMHYSLILSSHKGKKKKIASAYMRQYINFIKEIIDEGIKNNEFNDIDPKAFATLFVLGADIATLINSPKRQVATQKDIYNLLKNILFIKKS